MKTPYPQHRLRSLLQHTLLAAAIVLTAAATVQAQTQTTASAPAGKLEFASGEVTIRNAGTVRSQSHAGDHRLKGTPLASGDEITTGKGMAQIRFTDGGKVALYPNSQFEITRYLNAGDAGTDRSYTRLVKGTIRAITGAIGKRRKANYRIATRTATLGIRGSSFLMTVRQDDSLIVTTEQDGVEVCNRMGCVGLNAGETAYVKTADEPPLIINARADIPEAEILRSVDIAAEKTDDEGDAAVLAGAGATPVPTTVPNPTTPPATPTTPPATPTTPPVNPTAAPTLTPLGSLAIASIRSSSANNSSSLNENEQKEQVYAQGETKVQFVDSGSNQGAIDGIQKTGISNNNGIIGERDRNNSTLGDAMKTAERSMPSSDPEYAYVGYLSSYDDETAPAAAAGKNIMAAPFVVFASHTPQSDWNDFIAVSGANFPAALSQLRVNNRLYYRVSRDEQLVALHAGAGVTYGAAAGKIDSRSHLILDLGSQQLKANIWLSVPDNHFNSNSTAPDRVFKFSSENNPGGLNSQVAQVTISPLKCKSGCSGLLQNYDNAAATVVFVNPKDSSGNVTKATAGMAFRWAWEHVSTGTIGQVAAAAIFDAGKPPLSLFYDDPLENRKGDKELAAVAYVVPEASPAGTPFYLTSHKAKAQFSEPRTGEQQSIAELELPMGTGKLKADLTSNSQTNAGARSNYMALTGKVGRVERGNYKEKEVSDDFVYLGNWSDFVNEEGNLRGTGTNKAKFMPFMVGAPVDNPKDVFNDWKGGSGELVYEYERGASAYNGIKDFATLTRMKSDNTLITGKNDHISKASITIHRGTAPQYSSLFTLAMQNSSGSQTTYQLTSPRQGISEPGSGGNLALEGDLANCTMPGQTATCGTWRFKAQFMGAGGGVDKARYIGAIFDWKPEKRDALGNSGAADGFNSGDKVIGTVLLQKP